MPVWGLQNYTTPITYPHWYLPSVHTPYGVTTAVYWEWLKCLVMGNERLITGAFLILSGRVWYTQSMYTIVLCLLIFLWLFVLFYVHWSHYFLTQCLCTINNCILIDMREKKGTLILTFWLESREQNNELRMRPQISRGAVKEQTRLSRSSGIIPVLQVTVICLRGLWRRGLQHTHDAFTLLLAMLSILFLSYSVSVPALFYQSYALVCFCVWCGLSVPCWVWNQTLRLPDCCLPSPVCFLTSVSI